MVDRPDQRRDASGRIVAGAIPAARATAARSVIEAAGFAIEELADLTWRVAGDHVFHAAAGLWTGPGGIQGHGARSLVEHLRGRAATGAKPEGEEPAAS